MPHYFFILITQWKCWILLKPMEKVTDKRVFECLFAIFKENYHPSVNICFHLQQVHSGYLKSNHGEPYEWKSTEKLLISKGYRHVVTELLFFFFKQTAEIFCVLLLLLKGCWKAHQLPTAEKKKGIFLCLISTEEVRACMLKEKPLQQPKLNAKWIMIINKPFASIKNLHEYRARMASSFAQRLFNF